MWSSARESALLPYVLFAAFAIFHGGCDDESSLKQQEEPVTCPDDHDMINRPMEWSLESHCPGVEADYDKIFPDDLVHRFDITLSADDHDLMMDDLQQKLSGGAPGDSGDDIEDPVYVEATVEFEGKTWTHVGMRYKGNSSLKSAWQSGIRKLAFRLNFDYFEDQYAHFSDQRFYGFEKITFSNGYKDPSLMRDKLAADIFRAGGVPAARGAFAQVYVNRGEGPVYFGLYTMIEDPADDMLKAQHGDGSGNLYKPEGDGATWESFVEEDFEQKTNEDDLDWTEVVAALDALHGDRSDATVWRANLEEAFDVGAFLKCLAINQAMENWDSYGFMPHNYYLYSDPSDGGRITWFPWDLNLSMMHQMVGDVDPGSVMLDEISEEWPLVRYLLDDSVYRDLYEAELSEALESALDLDEVFAKIDAYHSLIEPHVIGEGGEAAPYTFLQNEQAFADSVDDDTTGLKPHLESRRVAVEDALLAK